MGKKPFDILAQPGQVNQLLNSQSIQTGGNGRKVTYLQDDYLVPLECNDDVYSVANLEALAKDIAQAGIRQPLIVFKNKEEKYSVLAGNRRLAAFRLAVEKYNAERTPLPCIIQQAPDTDESLRKRMIKDNLQREKTPYERMRELVVYREALESEWAKNPEVEHGDMRATLMEELGATQSEITRYFKINKALLPGLMDKFAQPAPGESVLLPTYVAHKLAKEEEAIQQYVLDNFDWTEPLTDARLTSVLASYYGSQAVSAVESHTEEAASKDSSTSDKEPERPAGPSQARKQYHFETVHDSTAHLTKVCSTLQEAISSQGEIDPKIEKKYLKRITAEIAKVEALIEEMNLYKSRAGYEKT